MDPRQPSSDRPNTLGQAWDRMRGPRPRKVADLPVLPDWPPLPEEKPRAGWPPPSGEAAPTEPNATDASQQTDSRETVQPLNTPRTRRQYVDLLDRWRHASRRVRLGIAGAVIISMLLIAACSNLALHALSAVGGGSAPAALGASATQQGNASGVVSSGSQTATVGPTATATSASTTAPTSIATVPLTITVTCAKGSDRGAGTVCVHTAASATLNLSVRYCDGSTAKGLHSAAVADSSGNYTWNWSVHMACVGPATATVIAKQNGVAVTATTTFNITA